MSEIVSAKKLIPKKSFTQNGFFKKYLTECKNGNIAPLNDIRRNDQHSLSLVADRIDASNWSAIISSLSVDQSLNSISIVLRRRSANVMQNIDSMKKLRKANPQVSILTKFLFDDLIANISKSLAHNNQISTLSLEGLPILPKYTQSLLKGISENTSINFLSFERSSLADEGCEAICNTIKYLPNVEMVNFSDCHLSEKCGKSISNLIKFQSFNRYSEAWKQSLRYRDVQPDTICGLKIIKINKNSQIGDNGFNYIIEALQDDEWIKVIEMKDCGLTDASADLMIDLLKNKKIYVTFDVKYNDCISKSRFSEIVQLQHEDTVTAPNSDVQLSTKTIIKNLKERISLLQDQLSIETTNRVRCEELNAQIQTELATCQRMNENEPLDEPDNYTSSEKGNFYHLVNELSILKPNQFMYLFIGRK